MRGLKEADANVVVEPFQTPTISNNHQQQTHTRLSTRRMVLCYRYLKQTASQSTAHEENSEATVEEQSISKPIRSLVGIECYIR